MNENSSSTPRPHSHLSDKAFGDMYEHMRAVANTFMDGESRQVTMQATALVHEAYLKMANDPTVRESRAAAIAAASRAMRQILVDAARGRRAFKRTGGRTRVNLTDDLASTAGTDEQLLELDEVLSQLAQIDPERAQLVQLKYFAGMTIEQIAETLDTSPATVKRLWVATRAWLAAELSKRESK